MPEAARRKDWPRSVAEFEAWHARQPARWEFVDGQPRLIAPASMKHSIIKNNVGFALRQALAGSPCTALVEGPQILTDEKDGPPRCQGERAAAGEPPDQLFLPVIATNEVGTLATLPLPHFGQGGLLVPCSEMVSTCSKASPHCSQRYAYVGIALASHAQSD
jgi:hypothetical protein